MLFQFFQASCHYALNRRRERRHYSARAKRCLCAPGVTEGCMRSRRSAKEVTASPRSACLKRQGPVPRTRTPHEKRSQWPKNIQQGSQSNMTVGSPTIGEAYPSVHAERRTRLDTAARRETHSSQAERFQGRDADTLPSGPWGCAPCLRSAECEKRGRKGT